MKLETAMSLATWATENRTQADFNAGNFNADCGFSDTSVSMAQKHAIRRKM